MEATLTTETAEAWTDLAPFTDRLAVDDIAFCDPHALTLPQNATSPATLWPVSQQERREFATAIQSVASTMAYLANTTAAKSSSSAATAAMLPAVECARRCALMRPARWVSNAASGICESVASRLVTVRVCPSLRCMMQEAAELETAFSSASDGGGVTCQTTMTLPSCVSSSPAEVCQAAVDIRRFSSTSTQALLTIVVPPLSSSTALFDDAVHKLLLSLVANGIQQHLASAAKAFDSSATAASTTDAPSGDTWNPGCRVAFLVPKSSVSALAVARLVDHFERVVGQVAVLVDADAATSASENDADFQEDTETVRTHSEIQEAALTAVSAWYAAKLLGSEEEEEDAAAAGAAGGESGVVVVPGIANCVAVLKGLRDGYDTSAINAVVWSATGAVRAAASGHSSNSDTKKTWSSDAELLIIPSEEFASAALCNHGIRDFILKRDVKLFVQTVSESGAASAFCYPSRQGTALTLRCDDAADESTSTTAHPKKPSNGDDHDFFSLSTIAELLLVALSEDSGAATTTNDAASTATAAATAISMPTPVVECFSSAVRILLLSGAISVRDASARTAALSAIMRGSAAPASTTPFFPAFDGRAPIAFRLNPLGRFVVRHAAVGIGLAESRLAVAMCALGMRGHVTNAVASLWSARAMRRRVVNASANGSADRYALLLSERGVSFLPPVVTAQQEPDASALALCCTIASYPFVCQNQRSVVGVLLYGATSLMSRVSLVHAMIASPLSSRLPLADRDSDSVSGASPTTWTLDSYAESEETTSRQALLAQQQQQQQQQQHQATSKTKRRVRHAMVVDAASKTTQQQQQQNVPLTRQQQAAVATHAFPGLASSAEPWCAVVPDVMCAVASCGRWLALPADCTTSLIALKSCIRVFADNAMVLFAGGSIQALPQMQATLLAHEGVKRLMAVHQCEQQQTATTIGCWVDLQLQRNALKRSQPLRQQQQRQQDSEQQDSEQQQQQQQQQASARTKLRDALRHSCTAALSGVLQQQQQQQQQLRRERPADTVVEAKKTKPEPTWAPFAGGSLPNPDTRKMIDTLAPKVLKQGFAKACEKLRGNAATAFAKEGHPDHAYFRWACNTYVQRKEYEEQLKAMQ